MAKNLKSGDNLIGKMYIGVVEDNLDPEEMGRVRVRIEYLFGSFSVGDVPTDHLPWWNCKMPVGLGSRADSSAFHVPEIGSQVTVMFPYEDINYGIVDGIIRGKKQITNTSNPNAHDQNKLKYDGDTNGGAYPDANTNVASGESFTQEDIQPTSDAAGKELNNGLNVSKMKFEKLSGDMTQDYPESYGWIDKIGNWFKANKHPDKKTVEFVHNSGSKFKIDKDGNVFAHITGNLKLIVDGDTFTQTKNAGHVYKGGRYTRVNNNEETQVGGQTIHRSAADNRINAANIKLNC